MAHLLEFSNTANNPIEVEEMGNPSERSEQGSTFKEEASSEENTGRNRNSKYSKDTSTTLDLEMVEDSLDENITTIGKGHHE